MPTQRSVAAQRPVLPNPNVIPSEMRDRLSPVVLEIYAAGDFHRVDMRSIAREAGMSFRTIYRYFGDKETLLFYFINHWLSELYPACVLALDEGGSLKEKLYCLLEAHLAFYEEHPNVGRIIFMTVPLERWMHDPSYAQPELIQYVLRLIKSGQQSGELRADIAALVILDAWSAIFNRAFLMWEYRRRKYKLTDQAAPLFSVLWTGIAGPARARTKSPLARKTLSKAAA